MDDLALPEYLLRRIFAIYPEFETEWQADHPGAASTLQSPHSVYMSLSTFAHCTSSSPRQLASLATLLNEAVMAGGAAENAVATCFLEHLAPSPLRKAIWPLLHPATKQRTRA